MLTGGSVIKMDCGADAENNMKDIDQKRIYNLKEVKTLFLCLLFPSVILGETTENLKVQCEFWSQA